MELTRFDLKNQALMERIAKALERIATLLEAFEGREPQPTPRYEDAADRERRLNLR